MRTRVRLLAGAAASMLVVAPLGWMWSQSLVPDTYAMHEMGYVDLGGGPRLDHVAHQSGDHTDQAAGPVSVSSLTGPREREPDVSVTLVARAESFDLTGDGAPNVEGYTLNHQSPGPEIRVRQGELVEVRLVNESVADGATLHWHGYDVPNAEDGVAGVTQNAVATGDEHVYRFVAEQTGTYWYHSHQVSHEQVRRGLFGTLVVLPRGPRPDVVDVTVPVHTYDGHHTIAGRLGDRLVEVPPGDTVRARIINTNNAPLRAWVSGSSFRVVAIDGVDVLGPTPLEDVALVVTAGGRIDIELETPSDGAGARIDVGGGAGLEFGPPGADPAPTDEPDDTFDALHYGSPAPLVFEPDAADRRFEYRIGRRIGFLDGRPGFWWTINGHLFPDVPMFMVEEGDVVRMSISNDSGEVHPMHLHGHHVAVLSRNGEPATGSPWWVDSLNVEDGESYEVAFVADNPGIWMDHCHNLPHAAEGLVTHLAYAGVTTPYSVGGPHDNEPE